MGASPPRRAAQSYPGGDVGAPCGADCRSRQDAYFGRSPTIPWLDLLRNARVTFRDEDDVDRPTVAGLLVFATEPTEFLASGSIEAACYRGARLSSDDSGPRGAARLAPSPIRSMPESPSLPGSCSLRIR